MIILNSMYTGRYITEQGKLGHEAINLVKADNGNFYIWLNSMGVCTHSGVDGCTVLMLRSINAHLYKIIAKAENCRLCDGAAIPRRRKETGEAYTPADARYEAQKELKVRYNGKDPMDNIFERDMFATFWTDKVQETEGDIYLTNDESLMDEAAGVYYAPFGRISEAMRAYIPDNHAASDSLKSILTMNVWKPVAGQSAVSMQEPKLNFFKLIRKDRDELSFSNALAYFIQEIGISHFLQNGLNLEVADNAYSLLREKHNIDLAFFGNTQVVIIENKIDAAITVDGRSTQKTQINRAVEAYFTKGIEDVAKQLESFAAGNQAVSQLSKYYFYAAAYLLSKNVAVEDIPQHIHCFLLVPKYAERQFQTQKDRFLLGDKYDIVTYDKLLRFFQKQHCDSPYYPDFVDALKPLAKEFNNDIEEDVKYRFYKAIK